MRIMHKPGSSPPAAALMAYLSLVVMTSFFGTAIADAQERGDSNQQSITLSCDGKASIAGEEAPENLKDFDVIVNVASRTVLGFGNVVGKVSAIDKHGIAFSGSRDVTLPGQHGMMSMSVVGFLDRIGGGVTANMTTVTLSSRVLSKKFDLHCARMSKLVFLDLTD